MSKKALEKGLITKKQYNNLNPGLLEAISKKKLKEAGHSGKSGKSYSGPDGKVKMGKRRKKGKGKK